MSILTLPQKIKHSAAERNAWGNLLGASASLAIAKSVKQHSCFSFLHELLVNSVLLLAQHQ